MQDTLEPVCLTPTPVALPLPLLGQASGLQIRGADIGSEPDLSWQTSIGQFIYLQSLAEERF